jgi:hypothetical protein
MFPRLVLLLGVLVLGNCSSMQRELSDDEWCRSVEYRPPRGNMPNAASGSTGSEPEQPKQDKGQLRCDQSRLGSSQSPIIVCAGVSMAPAQWEPKSTGAIHHLT